MHPLPPLCCALPAQSRGYLQFLWMAPGLWFGALLAPWLSRAGGPACDLAFFFLQLSAGGLTAVALSAAALEKGEPDVDADLRPLFKPPFASGADDDLGLGDQSGGRGR